MIKLGKRRNVGKLGREAFGALRFDDSRNFRAAFKKRTRRRRDRPSVRDVKVERGNR